MSYYEDVYLKRLNRYGYDYQSRKQHQREREFENYLLKSVYRIDFEYNNSVTPATLEPYKQDETETQAYLLTRVDVNIPGGTVLMLPNKDNILCPWMIWWLETMEASGYNRYVLLRMTHEISWVSADKEEHKQWAYFYGPGTTEIRDLIKSHAGKQGSVIYNENNNLHMFITTANSNILKDTYFEINETLLQAYRVTDLDLISTQGVEYVSVEPIYVYDHSEKLIQGPDDKSEDFYWLNGGATNGST